MTERILDRSGGVTEYLDWDEQADMPVVRFQADAEPAIEEAKRVANEGLLNPKSEFRRIAHIDIVAAMAWGKMNGLKNWWDVYQWTKDPANLSRMVHDRDMSMFRTLHGDFRGHFK